MTGENPSDYLFHNPLLGNFLNSSALSGLKGGDSGERADYPYIEQDVPYIDWSWYLWRAYHTFNEIEICAEHTAWGAYPVMIKVIWP